MRHAARLPPPPCFVARGSASLIAAKNTKTIANIIMGVIKSYLNEKSISIKELNIGPEYIAELADMINDNKISHIMMSQKLFPEMIDNNTSPSKIAKEKGWLQDENSNIIEEYVQKAIDKYPHKAIHYKKGNTNLIGLFMGEIMKASEGKLNPTLLNKILKNKLNQ